MKENFYIFLDIEGVLYDWQFIRKNKKCKEDIIKTFNPESVKALNKLILNLEKYFNVNLVISSTWRRNMLETEKVLKQNKVYTECFIDRIGSNHMSCYRGKEIQDYLKYKNETKNFVIIDDEWFDYVQVFGMEKVIKTHLIHGSLNMAQVNKFLQTFDNKLKNISNFEIC